MSTLLMTQNLTAHTYSNKWRRTMLRQLNANEIEDLLLSEVVGRIGCSAQGRTYVVPVVYAYDGKRILAHSAEGLKIDMMRENPEVCFEVDRIENLTTWSSVIVHGTFHELKEDAAATALSFLSSRVMPVAMRSSAAPPHSVSAANLKKTCIYGIHIREKSGRAEGFPQPSGARNGDQEDNGRA